MNLERQDKMKQSKERIGKSIEALRKIIDDDEYDEAHRRIAYFGETILRWAIEDTEDWLPPEKELMETVKLLKEVTGGRI